MAHQVNLEYLSKIVVQHKDFLYPDSVVGTDSHTTMVNGLGILGWGKLYWILISFTIFLLYEKKFFTTEYISHIGYYAVSNLTVFWILKLCLGGNASKGRMK